MKNLINLFRLLPIMMPALIILLPATLSSQQTAPPVTDIEGNSYKTVIIGNQTWFAENLKTATLNDGTEIQHVPEADRWTRFNDPAWSLYDNDIENRDLYGAMYNWYAVKTGKLCPQGWRVPDNDDWDKLTDFLGGLEVAGGKLKETGVEHWDPPNTGADNESGFSALPGGYRYGQFWGAGRFLEAGLNGYWWSATECTGTHSWSRTVHAKNTKVYRSFFTKNKGFSVRCIKED